MKMKRKEAKRILAKRPSEEFIKKWRITEIKYFVGASCWVLRIHDNWYYPVNNNSGILRTDYVSENAQLITVQELIKIAKKPKKKSIMHFSNEDHKYLEDEVRAKRKAVTEEKKVSGGGFFDEITIYGLDPIDAEKVRQEKNIVQLNELKALNEKTKYKYNAGDRFRDITGREETVTIKCKLIYEHTYSTTEDVFISDEILNCYYNKIEKE